MTSRRSPPKNFRHWRLVIGGVALLVLLLLGLSVHWFFDNYERRYHETRSDLSPSARRNPLLAAERFLTALSIPASSHPGRERLTRLPAAPGTLVIERIGRPLQPHHQQQLLDWVHAGGQVILPAPPADHSATDTPSLLEELGVQRRKHPCPPTLECPPALLPLPHRSADPDPPSVRFDPATTLHTTHHPLWQMSSEQGAHLLALGYGSGTFILLSDNAWLHNEAIGDHAHALLLAHLVAEQQPVWLLYGSDMPPLWRLIWLHLPHLTLAASVTLLLWLLYLTRYSGPPIPPPERARRNLLEHYRAAVAHHWAIDRGATLTRHTQQSLEQHWCRHHPQLNRLTPEQRYQWIADHTPLTPHAITLALSATPENSSEFVRITAIQQRLLGD